MIKDCDHEPWLETGLCLVCSPPEGWQHNAECLKHDPDICYPEDDDPVGYAIARRMCEECPVISFCLEIGIGEKHGMWGGLTPSERYKLRKSKQLPVDRLEKRRFLRVYAYTT